jgi:hypothetical protein
VLAAGITVALERAPQPLARATTTLQDVSRAVVVGPSSATVAARDGMRVAPGDVVRTHTGGRATLVTRSRAVYLGPSTTEQVMDGARQQLRTGSVVVDAARGPGLTLGVAQDSVSVPAGSATEATRSVTVRVGGLAGAARLRGPGGREVLVPALAQALATGDAVPVSTAPLQLSDSPGEAAAAPTLVADDEALRTLAHGIDTTGRATATTVEASWHGTAATVPASLPSSERALPVLIADAAPASAGPVQQRYDRAVSARSQGGSWGVVLHLLHGHSAAVLRAFDAAERSVPAGQLGEASAQTVAAVAASAGRAGAGRAAGGQTSSHSPGSPGSSPGSPSRGGGGSSGSGGTPPSGGGSGGGTPNPPPSPAPVRSVVKAVRGVVSGVVGLLTPTPTPTPSPSGGITGLVGGLLGGGG